MSCLVQNRHRFNCLIALLLLAVTSTRAWAQNGIPLVAAEIDFTGTELTLTFQENSVPTEVRIARSNGVPSLKKGTTDLRLIWSAADWELDRRTGSEKTTLRARYRIHDEDRAEIAETGFTVTIPAGLIKDEASTANQNDAVTSPFTVANNSEVDADGWREFWSDTDEFTTIYVDALNGNNANDGLSPSTAKRTFDAGWEAFHDLSDNVAHRLLFARGQTFVGEPTTYNKGVRKGKNFRAKRYIGTYDSGDGSTKRPRLMTGRLVIDAFTHIDGIEFLRHPASRDDGASESGRAVFGRAEATSMQDCIVDVCSNLEIMVLDRCVLRPIPNNSPAFTQFVLNTSNMSNPPAPPAWQRYRWSNNHVVYKYGEPGLGHGIYEIGISYAHRGTSSHYWNMLYVGTRMQDMHRSRAELQYCSMYRMVQDWGGNGPVSGANQFYSFTVFTPTPVDGTWTQTTANSGVLRLNPNALPGDFTNSIASWHPQNENYYARFTHNVPNLGLRQITQIARDSTTNEWLVYCNGDPGSQGQSYSNVKGGLGEGPWRARNQSYRHVFNFNPGFTNQPLESVYMNGLGDFRDTAGFWYSDSLSLQSFESTNVAPSMIFGPNRTGDDLARNVDVHLSNLSLARVKNHGFRISGRTSSPQAWFKRNVVDSITDDQRWVIGFWHEDITNPGAWTPTVPWNIDENVYSYPVSPSTRFEWNGPIGWNSGTVSWNGTIGFDPNSLNLPQTGATRISFNGDSADTYKPDLSTYADETGIDEGGTWFPPASGPLQGQFMLAIETRPYRVWDKRLDAETIVRWALRKYKPWPASTTTNWPGNSTTPPNEWWVGAADYRLNPPTNVVPTGGPGQASLTWTAPANQGRVTRYVIRYGTSSTAPLTQEADVWNDTDRIVPLTPGNYYFEIHSSDGWNESGPSSRVGPVQVN